MPRYWLTRSQGVTADTARIPTSRGHLVTSVVSVKSFIVSPCDWDHRCLTVIREHYAGRDSVRWHYTQSCQVAGRYGSMTQHCLKDKNIIELHKKYSILRTFMEFCNCYSYRTNSRMSWLLRSWVHNCQTKNGLNPLKIAANVDLTRWKVARIGLLYVVDRTLSRHSQSDKSGVTMGWGLHNSIPVPIIPTLSTSSAVSIGNRFYELDACRNSISFFLYFVGHWGAGSWFHDEIQWPGPVT